MKINVRKLILFIFGFQIAVIFNTMQTKFNLLKINKAIYAITQTILIVVSVCIKMIFQLISERHQMTSKIYLPSNKKLYSMISLYQKFQIQNTNSKNKFMFSLFLHFKIF